MLLSPLFRNAAPGNLGKPDLMNLPSRSKIALPKMPSLRQQQLEGKDKAARQPIENDDQIDLTLDDFEFDQTAATLKVSFSLVLEAARNLHVQFS